MYRVLLSVLPIFLLIVTGYVTKNRFIKEDTFWKASDALIYYLCFPALLVLEITGANFSGVGTFTALYAILGAILSASALLFISQVFLKTKPALFTSIFQGGVRYSPYVFIALAQSLFGHEGIAQAGFFVAYMVVVTNVLSVLVLSRYVGGGSGGLRGVVLPLAKNPVVLSALGGLVLNRLGVHFEGVTKQFLQYLGGAATPMSLMSVGAGLVLAMEARRVLAVGFAVAVKLCVMPLFVFIWIKCLGAKGPSANIALLFGAMPCAGNAYILACQMGGDAEAMASIITWSMLISIVTIPVLLGALL